jgi:hypothetical protein
MKKDKFGVKLGLNENAGSTLTLVKQVKPLVVPAWSQFQPTLALSPNLSSGHRNFYRPDKS